MDDDEDEDDYPAQDMTPSPSTGGQFSTQIVEQADEEENPFEYNASRSLDDDEEEV